MKKIVTGSCVILVLGAGSLLLPARAQPSSRVRWEQECQEEGRRDGASDINAVLRRRGSDGWEFVQATAAGVGHLPLLCFRRPVP